MSELHDAAIEYAKRGWHIFPLGPGSKMPAIEGGRGFYDATDDVARIEKWWTNHPDHNIGLAVGASGLYVVDIDGERGAQSLEMLLSEQGNFPETLRSITGHGFHYFFTRPNPGEEQQDLGNTAGTLGQGIDTRGNGGYVVLPPSLHPDGSLYEWHEESAPIVPLPQWIVTKLDKPVWIPPKHSPAGYSVNVHPYVRAIWERVQGDLRAECQRGNRNNALNKAAIQMGHWVGSNSITKTTVEEGLSGIALNSGLGEREVVKTLQSGLEAGMAEPCWPPEPDYQHENKHQQAARVSEGSIAINRGSSFGRRKVEYLWGFRIPLGKLTVLSGPSNIGKSFISLSLAAHVTAGVPLLGSFPDQRIDGEVLFCSYEDDIEDTIGPRADDLGVDMDRCHFITGVDTEHGQRDFGPQDVPQIVDYMKQCPLKLVVIDPLGSFMGASVNASAENETRAVLGTLVNAARETGAAVVIVAHYNKASDSPDPLHRIAGSQGISALPRSVLMANWGENGERLITHQKASTSPTSPTVAYEFDDTFRWTKIHWSEDDATRWLRSTLRKGGGKMWMSTVYDHAHAAGMVDSDIAVARDAVKPIIFVGQNGQTTWTLP